MRADPYREDISMPSQKAVTPAKAGVQMFYDAMELLDSGFRRNDDDEFRLISEFL